MLTTIPGIEFLPIPLTGGVDETSPVTKLNPEDYLEMENFRLSKDNRCLVKRTGLSEQEQVVYGYGNPTVYGYFTYTDNSDEFCQVFCGADDLWLKIGSGAENIVHSWSSSLTHPLKPVEVQDKIFCVFEEDSRFINKDGDDFAVGIPEPSTLPTVTETTGGSPPLDEDFDYADTAALTAGGWVDEDSNGESVLVSGSDPNGDAGPDADQKYLRFYDDSPSAPRYNGNYAQRTKEVTSIGSKYNLEFDVYFDDLGYVPWNGETIIEVYNGTVCFKFRFAKPWSSYWNGVTWETFYSSTITRDAWVNWKFAVDATNSSAASFTAYRNGTEVGSGTFDNTISTATSEITIQVKTGSTDLYDDYGEARYPDVYFDHIKISGEDSGELSGIYKYAVTFGRAGNFGAESNPIYSEIGSTTYTQGGASAHDDLTVGGKFSGAESIDWVVEIDDASGDPDKFKFSVDDGETWHSTGIPITRLSADSNRMFLPHGIYLTFDAVDGHEDGDKWEFTTSVCSGTMTDQQCNLSNIPTPSAGQVTNNGVNQRKLYRTTVDGNRYYWLATINDTTTTTFVDNISDQELGAEIEFDHDEMPSGRLFAWWDNRAWVTGKKQDEYGNDLEDLENMLYYSKTGEPEHFDISAKYIIVRIGGTAEKITGLIPYKDQLYVFKESSIYKVVKYSTGFYGLQRVTADVGCVAPWSVLEVNNLLMFYSHRGWELFNGRDTYSLAFSLPLAETLDIAETNFDTMQACHSMDTNEIWLYLGSGREVAVYNYAGNKFYTFDFAKTPYCLQECKDTNNKPTVYMGSNDGYVYKCNSTYQDLSTNITATARKGWIVTEMYADIRKLLLEYEIPETMSLTVNCYVNMEASVKRTSDLTGEDVAGTDIEFRRAHHSKIELGQRAKYFSVEFTNAENLGGNLKINEVILAVKQRAIKDKIYGDSYGLA